MNPQEQTPDDLRGNSVAALTLRKDRKKKIIKGTKKTGGLDKFTPNPEITDEKYITNY